MILGLGIDLVEIQRIDAALQRWGERFAGRILQPKEWRFPLTPTFVAGRFAAKEALVKALGTGFTQGIGWHDLEIAPTPGAPHVCLRGKAHARFQELGGHCIHLSISHSQTHATAVAIIEARAQTTP